MMDFGEKYVIFDKKLFELLDAGFSPFPGVDWDLNKQLFYLLEHQLSRFGGVILLGFLIHNGL